MSSGISIDEGRLKPAVTTDMGAVDVSGVGSSRPDDGFRPWHFFVLASILLATAAVIMARQAAAEHLVLISFSIAAAGAAAGALYRMLAPLTAPVVLRMGEPVSERTRAALEREKLLVMRSIKELEFDRGMGKVSQSDFDEMAGRLRARALSLMKQLDLGGSAYADAIERELASRVRKGGRASHRDSKALRGNDAAPPDTCACGTANDHDAVFCKKCGTRLRA
jgi:hypothetical protein